MRIQKRFMDPTGTVYAPQGEIRADRRPGEVLWMRERGRIYITCKSCSAINDITGHQRVSAGEIHIDRVCFVCTNCQTHYYFSLMKHKAEEVIWCNCCRRVESHLSVVTNKGEIRNLRKKGWYIEAQGIKAQRSRCPQCIKVYGRTGVAPNRRY